MHVYFRGHKLPVDDSSINYDETFIPYTSPAVIACDAPLKPWWLVSVQENPVYAKSCTDLQEITFEKAFDHEPTEDDIIEVIASANVPYGIAIVQKGYALNGWRGVNA